MYKTPSARRLLPGCLLSALAISTCLEGAAHAEIDAGFFVGAHLFNDENRLSRSGSPTPQNGLDHSGIVGLRFAYLPIPRLALESELGIIPTSTHDASSRLGVLALRGHLLVNLLTGRVRPFLLAGGGGMFSMPSAGSKLKSDLEGALHAGAGLQVDFVKNWGLRIDGRAIFPQAIEQPLTVEGEVLLGFYGRFDSEPQKKEPPQPAAEAKPTAALDSDGDGTPDGRDRCPGIVGPSENDGCPDKDSDGDGVIDRLDACPSAAGKPGGDGCPDKDSDGDGVVDSADRCPQSSGPADNGGCPDTDTDGDGIVDRLDKCPSQPETRNQYQDEDGCPDEVPKAVAQFTGTIAGITFEPNSAVITNSSLPVLDKAIAVLREHASVRLQITGHTDNSGAVDQNRALSQARAAAVRAYFVSQGINESRLTAVGMGPDKPLADNATPQGRAKNRRVEFSLLGQP